MRQSREARSGAKMGAIPYLCSEPPLRGSIEGARPSVELTLALEALISLPGGELEAPEAPLPFPHLTQEALPANGCAGRR